MICVYRIGLGYLLWERWKNYTFFGDFKWLFPQKLID